MNTRKLMRIRKWFSLVGILSILSSLVLSIPIASATYTSADAAYKGEEVAQALERGIVDGSGDLTHSMDRGEGFVMFTRGFGLMSDTAKSPLTDLKTSDWWTKAAHTAYTLGWLDNTKTTFDHAGTFTRAQIALVGARVLGLTEGADLTTYTDAAKIPNWPAVNGSISAKDAMAAMVKAEIMGVGTTKLMPNDPVTKLDGILILNRMYTLWEDQGIDLLEVVATKLSTEDVPVTVEQVQALLDDGQNWDLETGEAVDVTLADETPPTDEGGDEGDTTDEEDGTTPPADDTTPVTPPVTPPATTTAVVTLGANNLQAGTLVQGQAGARLADFTFTNNGAAELKVTKVDLTRIGVSADATLPRVYLYEGTKRLTEDASVSTGVISWTNSEGIFTVAAGASKTISVKANIANTTSGQTVGVALTAATGITANATVTGTFPLNGSLMTIASATLAGFDFAAITQPAAANLALDPQTDFIAWQNTVSIGTRAVNLSYINFKVIGSIALTDINNFRLFVDGVAVGTAVANADANGYVLFDMSAAPKKIDTGSRVFKVLADVLGGSTRSFQLALRQTADIKVVDTEYNVDILATVGAGTFTVLQGGLQTVTTGTLNITKYTTSPSGNVVLNGTNVTLGTFELKALGEKMKVENLRIAVDVGTNAATTIKLRNGALYVYDEAAAETTAVQVGSTAALNDINNATLGYTEYSLGSSLIVEPNHPKLLLIKADVYDSGSTTSSLAAAQTITARVVAGSTNVQAMTSAGYSSVPAVFSPANALSIKVGTVALTKDQSYGNQNAVVPQSNYKMAQFVLTNGANEDVNLDTFTVTLTDGSEFVAADLTNLYIKYGDKSTSYKATGQASQSWSLSQTLTKSQSMTIQVFADIASTAVVTETVADTMTTNLLVSGTTANSGTTVTTNSGSVLVGQVITAKTSGTLNVSVDNTILASQVIAGSTPDSGSLKLKLAATNEDLYVKSITFRTNLTANDVAVASATLWQSQGGAAYTQVAGLQTLDADGTNPGFVTWALGGADRVKVSKSGTTYLLLKPTYVSSSQDANVLDKTPSFNLADLQAEGVSTIAPTSATPNLTINGGLIPGASTALFAAPVGGGTIGTTTTAGTTTVTLNSAPTTLKTGQFILFDYNSSATYTSGDEIGYVMLDNANGTLVVQRGVLGTTAAAGTGNIYFLAGTGTLGLGGSIAGVTQTVLNTKLTITPSSDTPQGAALSFGTAKLLFKFDVAATANTDPPSGINTATLTRVDITTTKSGMTVNDLLIYPAESGYDNNSSYVTTCAALSSSKWKCTMATGGNTNQITFGTTRSYAVRGTIASSAINAAPGISIASLSTGGDVTWNDGSHSETWVNQAATDVKPVTQPSFGAISGTADVTVPTITSLALTDGSGAAIGAGDTIVITYSEIIDPSTINATLKPDAVPVSVTWGATTTGSYSLLNTTSVVTLVNLATFDISAGTTTGALSNNTTLALDITGKILTVTVGAGTTAWATSPAATFSLVGATSTATVTDVNGNALAGGAAIATYTGTYN